MLQNIERRRRRRKEAESRSRTRKKKVNEAKPNKQENVDMPPAACPLTAFLSKKKSFPCSSGTFRKSSQTLGFT